MTCNRVKVGTTGAGDYYRFDFTFKKKCAGYLAARSPIVSTTTVTYAAVPNASGTYTDTVYSFSATVGQTLSIGGNMDYGGFEIIGS